MKIWAIALSIVLAVAGIDAHAAKRLGGGKSVGKQSNNVTQREATPTAPGAPTQNAANAAKPSVPAAAPPAAPKRPWGAMLGGLAAGLGLAWLAHSLGMGEAFGQFMLFALLALVIMLAVGWFVRSRRASQNNAQPAGGAPYAFQGATAGAGSADAKPAYRPENVGNDASARPWERNSMGFEVSKMPAAEGSMIGSAIGGSQNWFIPADFDTDSFLKAAKENFVTLQAAWDKSDIPALRSLMTDGMVQEIQTQLAQREVHTGGPFNHTDVVMLEAQLLGLEDLGTDYMVSVEFSGMIREDPSSGPSPFREVWNMTKPKSGTVGWLVAGVQALQ